MWKLGLVHACRAQKVISNCRNVLALMKELEAELRLVFWDCWYIVVYRMAIIKSSRNYECVIVCHKCIWGKLNMYCIFLLQIIQKKICIDCMMKGNSLPVSSVLRGRCRYWILCLHLWSMNPINATANIPSTALKIIVMFFSELLSRKAIKKKRKSNKSQSQLTVNFLYGEWLNYW